MEFSFDLWRKNEEYNVGSYHTTETRPMVRHLALLPVVLCGEFLVPAGWREDRLLMADFSFHVIRPRERHSRMESHDREGRHFSCFYLKLSFHCLVYMSQFYEEEPPRELFEGLLFGAAGLNLMSKQNKRDPVERMFYLVPSCWDMPLTQTRL